MADEDIYAMTIPGSAAETIMQQAAIVSYAVAVGLIVMGWILDQPVWWGLTGGLLLLGTALLLHQQALYDERTILGNTGRRYPRFEIVNYLDDDMLERIHEFQWIAPVGNPSTRALRGFHPTRDIDAVTGKVIRYCCPLGAAVNDGHLIPVAPTVMEEIVKRRPEVLRLTKMLEITKAASTFIQWNDTGNIHPADVSAIFKRR